MDRQLKLILSVIALALCVVAFQLSRLASVPTRGDWIRAAGTKDSTARRERFMQLYARTPLTWVHGGSVEVSNEVEVVIGREVDVFVTNEPTVIIGR